MTHALILIALIGPGFLAFYLSLRRMLRGALDEMDAFGFTIIALALGCVWPITLTFLAATREPARVRRARERLEEARLLDEWSERVLGAPIPDPGRASDCPSPVPQSKENP